MTLRNIAVVSFMIMALSKAVLAEDNNPARIGPSATISFAQRTTTLSAESKNALDSLIRDARSKGRINEFQVAAWSDNPAPRENEQLSQPDRTIAEKRAKNVNKYLKAHSKGGHTTFNMAERASWLARTFNTPQAELKSEIGQGGEGRMSREEFQIFKDSGKPSKAVVLVILKH